MERATSSRTVEELWAFHVEDMAQYGFDRILYGLTTAIDQPAFGELDDILVLSNHEPSYLQPYLERRMYVTAPMVRWARHNSGSCSWGWIGENRGTFSNRELDIISFNLKHKVTAGYSISFPMVGAGKKAAIGMAARAGMSQSDVDAIWAEKGREIEVKNTVFNLKLITLPLNLRANKLSDRQREVLEWVGNGHTLQEIADGLALKVTTIEKHLRLARDSLGVDSTAQAVLKAALHNQIYVVRG
jgi:LuxR family transcriptional regulator